MIRNLIISMCAILLLTSSGFAADKFVVPKHEVTGAENVIPVNELIILKAGLAEPKPKYLHEVQYNWLVFADGKEKKNVLVFPDNTTIGFGRGSAKQMHALLVINYLYVVRENDDPVSKITEVAQRSSGIIYIDIKLDGSNPNPPNPPIPPGPVDPEFPDGKFKLAKVVYDLANSKVPQANRVKGAHAMATATAGISSAIRAGALREPAEILTKLKDANNNALKNAGVDVSDWDEFGLAFQDKLVELYRANKLKVASDYADVFDEVAIGLNKVK